MRTNSVVSVATSIRQSNRYRALSFAGVGGDY